MLQAFFYTSFLAFLTGSELVVALCDIPQVKRYGVAKAAVPPIIDGNIHDAAWEKAPWTDDFENILGAAVNPVSPVKIRTRAKILWDEGFIYVAAEILDPFIVANLSHIPDSGETAKTLGEAFQFGILNRTDSQQPSDQVIHEVLDVTNDVIKHPRNLWSLEWAIPWSHVSRKRDSGWPPSSGSENQSSGSRGRRRRYLLNLIDNIVFPEKYHLTWNSPPDRDVMNPQWWGTVEFLDSPTAREIVDPEYSVRYILNVLYELQRNYFESFGVYSADLTELMPNATVFRECYLEMPTIELLEDGGKFSIHLKLNESKTGHISDDRLLWFS
ncbi:hypothetical protein K493DRAFT_295735 [Basidiobolus meristosporus CBS 931.73]|uniref:Carbohydrate-binding domain-containing protein n=1 Tax=Basidiobolus meristosporus CBS 931.73 TaxID=1314790 RepID=A0A1Y1Z9N4_9FUNG|nr:hypothetical protein K493DRAFT_295735 [Basidiobolus meristosporus CBS 931.73]|eukprot:ORY06972.1 hypothetical protein K493DRAFT_295735 [Basidiobolus meristosporus CBS 931.73]